LDDPTAPSLKNSLLAPLAPGQREWVLGLAGAMLLVNLLRQILPGILAGIVGLLALIVLSIMAFNAGTDALRQAAAGPGARGARLFSSEFSEGLGVRLIVSWLLATILLAAFMQLDRYLGLAIGLMIVTAILPAVTIVLVLSNSFLEALYPPRLARLIARIGRRDYAGLCALVIMVGIAYLTILALLRSLGLPDFLRSALLFGIWTWAVLAWFRHAGDMLFAHRDELNLVEPDSAADRPPEKFTRDPDALWVEIRSRGGTREMHAELARQLERGGNRERMLEHARLHIETLLLAFEAPEEALYRSNRMLELDAAFALPRPDSMFALIRAAAERKHGWLTGQLVASYLEAFPNSVKRNEVRLLACEALCDEATAGRRKAEAWFRALMTTELSDTQRTRLSALAPGYVDAGPDPD